MRHNLGTVFIVLTKIEKTPSFDGIYILVREYKEYKQDISYAK